MSELLPLGRRLLLGVAFVATACGAHRSGGDGGLDAGAGDAGRLSDGGRPDAGLDGGVDAGFDGGADGGAGADSGIDAGFDAGVTLDDAGCPVTPPWNLVKNGTFECHGGGLDEWSVDVGTSSLESPGHAGSTAAIVTMDSSGAGRLSQPAPILDFVRSPAVCARVFLRGTVPDARLELLALPSGQAFSFTSPVASATWLRAPPVTNLAAPFAFGERVYVVVRAINGAAGQTMVVDDLEVWESPSGQCTEH